MSVSSSSNSAPLTPYQGDRRCFGYYKCSNCERNWSSANSWANCTQKCRNCNTKVYPFKQRRLKKSGRPRQREEGKNHLIKLCEKCKTLGVFCGRLHKSPKIRA